MLRNIWNSIVAIISVAVMLATINWPSISAVWIKIELRSWARAVRQSEIGIDQKEQLLDDIDRIENWVRDGSRPAFVPWLECRQTLNDMAQEGISADEGRLFRRELRRLEATVKESSSPVTAPTPLPSQVAPSYEYNRHDR
jgi:hypothetical protein